MSNNIEVMDAIADDLMQDTDTSGHTPDPSSTEGPNQNPTAMQVLGMEMREHAVIARDYKQKIDEAKTEAKKRYYKKKLAKNNKQAFQILLALEEMGRLKKIEESEAAPEETEQPDDATTD